MAPYFDNIFIPVDFSINTEVAVSRALKLCEPGCTIHMFHVRRWMWPCMLSLHTPTEYFIQKIDSQDGHVQSMLAQWKASIEEERADINVLTWMSYDLPIQKAIIKKAIQLHSTLIIIGKHSNHTWFPFLNTLIPSEIADNAGIPVLTVKPGALNCEIKNIVVPIGMAVPEKKLEMIEALRRKFRIHVHLVTYVNEKNNQIELIADTLSTTYNHIKRKLACLVTYNILSGTNKGKALLKYCKNVSADMVLVEPKTETKIGWMNKHLSDEIPDNSKTQVMALQS